MWPVSSTSLNRWKIYHAAVFKFYSLGFVSVQSDDSDPCVNNIPFICRQTHLGKRLWNPIQWKDIWPNVLVVLKTFYQVRRNSLPQQD